MSEVKGLKTGHKQLFDKFCREKYLEKSSSTSKTVSKEKSERIKQVLRGRKVEVHSSSFIFWVKKNKKFQLLSYPELDLHDVLCVAVKTEVFINFVFLGS